MLTRSRTVVFTDVVGSTELVAALGDREAERVLLAHFDELRRETERRDGVLVKTLGDGVMAVFEAAAPAVAAAVAMQQVTAGRTFTIRIGISSGDVELAGSDCHGVAVVEASRLCAAAAGGEILVSETTRLTARGGELVCEERGVLELKGLPEPVATWAVAWAPGQRTKLRVVVADDAVLLRQGISHVLRERGFDVVGEAGDGEAVVALARDLRPDVVVVDVRMPPTNTTEGLEAAERMRAADPGIGVLVLSQEVESHSARRLLALGREGLGYLLKERVTHVGEFAEAVERVAGGGTAFEDTVLASLEDA